MKALVTLATGSHRELLDIAMPSFQTFADRHGYEIVQPDLRCRRPVSWWKVPALAAVLDAGYEEALWVDADVVIVDPTEDLDAPDDAWQALVEHHTGDGDVPNCGVWLVRTPMRPYLDEIWATPEGPWWEQSALHGLMGYIDGRPARRVKRLHQTELFDHTHFLDNGWNTHVWDDPPPLRPRCLHATMHSDRPSKMREWAEMAAAREIHK